MKKTLALCLAASLGSIAALAQPTIATYVTAEKTEFRLTNTGQLKFTGFRQPFETEPFVLVDPKASFQSFIGIGGALTDASAETFARLPKDQQQDLLRAYYDKTSGIGYSLARTNIMSCDFSSDSYSYIKEGDTAFKTWDLSHDQQYKIPLIKQAIAAAGGKLSIFVSPWSPPAFMKDNNNVLGGGKLLPAYRAAWARFYVKFIRSYEAIGIPIWGLSVQNEPMAKQKWESCIFTAEDERDFIKNDLGPTLRRSGMSDKKLIAWDHNRDLLYQRASTILEDPAAAKYVWGIGYHWYETWTGGPMQFENMSLTAKAFPDKNLLFTEGCIEKFDYNRLSSWSLGERYGYSMVNDFNHGATGWTDWNILLDENGGPNHVGNFCFAPLHADTRTGKLIYTNAFYYIGHFSKFLRPGAKRIAASSNRAQLQTTAFQNPDGSILVVVLNTTDEKLPYHLMYKDKAAETQSLPHSITSLVIK